MRISPSIDWMTTHLRRASLFILLGTLLLLAGCNERLPQVGERPANELPVVVEAYLQEYQPGPLPRLFQSTYIYDRNGELLAELYSEGRRTWVSLDRISPHLIDATISTEDATFLVNTGIDPFRIAGAALQNLEEGEIVSGASTITMQLARNLFLGANERYDQELDRKILEAGLARELTTMYTKREILEMYLNLLNYGHLTYGPEAASQTYFGKSAADLSLAEATLLAGVPQQPARLDPLRNFEAAKQRQRTVLDLMVRHGNLSQAEADAVFAEPIQLNTDAGVPAVRAPHFVNYVIDHLDARLGEGYVRRAGLRIYTSLDLTLQNVAEEIVARRVAELSSRYGMNNAALIAMKPGTGEILAMVGSIDYNDASIDGQVNVATSLRQPGSAIKPILYATALNDNLISPATVLWDTPVTYEVSDREEYEPKNYDREFHGPVTARSALANSYNVPAVKLLNAVSVERMLDSARQMGINSLFRGTEWYGLSLALGGGEVSLLELATAYHTIANGGVYLSPRPVLAVHDNSNASLMDTLGDAQGRQVISEAAAFLLTDIMSDNNARVPMFGSNSWLHLSRPAAAKTGTTDDNRDAWLVGFTRYLLTGVWTGNTQGRPMNDATGVGAAGPIWNEFMETVLNDPELLARIGAPSEPAAWEFPPSPGVERIERCPPGLTCRADGSEYFSTEWLALAEMGGGPLADSVIEAPSASVYVPTDEDGRRFIGYCLSDSGARRQLVRLPARFGLPSMIALEDGASAEEKQALVGSVATDVAADPNSLVEEVDLAINERSLDDETLQERRQALPYTGKVRGQVSLGPCDEVRRLVSSAIVVEGEIATPEPAEESTDEEQTDEEPVITEEELAESEERQPGEAGLLPTGAQTYQLAEGIRHDNSCPGNYIMGRVVNQDGAPMAGVTVRLEDTWGNVYHAQSKSGPNDYGMFDFPLYSDSPQDFKLTVLDGAGNPASPIILIPHRRSQASDYPCHFVTIRGG